MCLENYVIIRLGKDGWSPPEKNMDEFPEEFPPKTLQS